MSSLPSFHYTHMDSFLPTQIPHWQEHWIVSSEPLDPLILILHEREVRTVNSRYMDYQEEYWSHSTQCQSLTLFMIHCSVSNKQVLFWCQKKTPPLTVWMIVGHNCIKHLSLWSVLRDTKRPPVQFSPQILTNTNSHTDNSHKDLHRLVCWATLCMNCTPAHLTSTIIKFENDTTVVGLILVEEVC